LFLPVFFLLFQSIIEGLKFVTTGSLPPLSDGGKSFVHDPKMEGSNLVKAQVKLNFTTADDKTVLAIRNFQLSQKKAKREFKGMEAVLQTRDADGRESSVSHRCADMEKLVPQLMGVSPAVLDNVIFVHQVRGNTNTTTNAEDRARDSSEMLLPCSFLVVFLGRLPLASL
jgi:DNA repair exonuclease SbcCD ATPase subunit